MDPNAPAGPIFSDLPLSVQLEAVAELTAELTRPLPWEPQGLPATPAGALAAIARRRRIALVRLSGRHGPPPSDCPQTCDEAPTKRLVSKLNPGLDQQLAAHYGTSRTRTLGHDERTRA